VAYRSIRIYRVTTNSIPVFACHFDIEFGEFVVSEPYPYSFEVSGVTWGIATPRSSYKDTPVGPGTPGSRAGHLSPTEPRVCRNLLGGLSSVTAFLVAPRLGTVPGDIGTNRLNHRQVNLNPVTQSSNATTPKKTTLNSLKQAQIVCFLVMC
jgi:hypothetical protein